MTDPADRSAEKLNRTLIPSAGLDGEKPPTPEQVAGGQRLQASLCRLRGIREARVRPSRAGAVEVTVLALPERSESDTVADVRVLAQRAGLDLDDLKVRVMGARQDSSVLPRRKLSSLSTKRYGERFTAQVTLELEGDALVGEVDVPVGRRFEYRSVARAILNSVRRLIPYALQLEHVEVLTFGAERLAVVSISSRDDILVGSALVRGDELDSIARATLDAINRVLNLSALDLVRVAKETAASS
jgi:hypothetical protein